MNKQAIIVSPKPGTIARVFRVSMPAARDMAWSVSNALETGEWSVSRVVECERVTLEHFIVGGAPVVTLTRERVA